VLRWFDTTVYAPNALGTFGTSPRNALRGPGYKNVDLGVHKNFATGGHTELQVRIEAFNVFNWVNLGTPVTAQNSGNFGRITTALDPRIMQLAMRWQF
jgi:hypothetical protein